MQGSSSYKGKYISHLRSEGNEWVEAVEELIRIRREAGLPAEIYHIKAAGRQNWSKVDKVIALVNAARRKGLKITADMYMYPAGATGLNASLPPWTMDGGYEALSIMPTIPRANTNATVIMIAEKAADLIKARVA